jgi:thiol-disulfide isomerase/thioredoxin
MKVLFISLAALLLLGALPATAGDSRFIPGLVLTDLQGEEYALDTVTASGKNVVLVHWQTWCQPCKKEAPHLNAAYGRFGDKLAFFGIVSGSGKFVKEDKVLATIKDWHLLYPQVRDRDASLAIKMEVEATPTIVILGKKGKVLYYGHRAPQQWEKYLGTGTAQ